jgi:hypothetical protein
MVAVKVWLGGEGPSELGDRDHGGTRVGALEALLLRIEPTGWRVAGAVRWRSIRKYRAGVARADVAHGDVRNVMGLVLQAYEAGCEVVAFCRDVDADAGRAQAIREGIEQAEAIFAPPTFRAAPAIIGGVAKPALEGWILALRGRRDTDELSRSKANAELDALGLGGKHAEAYVEIIEQADLAKLPPGCPSLADWIERAQRVLQHAVRGRVER